MNVEAHSIENMADFANSGPRTSEANAEEDAEEDAEIGFEEIDTRGISTAEILFYAGVAFPILPLCVFCLACGLRRRSRGAASAPRKAKVAGARAPQPPDGDSAGLLPRGGRPFF